MRAMFAAVLALGILGGCAGFGRGFADEGGRQAASIVGDVVADKLGDNFKELKDGIAGIPGALPPMPEEKDRTLDYGLGALVAYILGSLGKGLLRDKMKKDNAPA